eukprot:3982206-Amphidinium_carterae.1
MTLYLNHLALQCMWVNPYVGGISPWPGKTEQQGKSVRCGNGVSSLGSITCDVRMTIPGKVRILSRPPIIPECLGLSPSHGR